MKKKLAIAALVAAAALVAPPALAQNYPNYPIDEMRGSDFEQPVKCIDTHFSKITGRFGEPAGLPQPGAPPGSPPSGMDVFYANGVVLIAYSVDPVAIQERPGERVQLCYLGRVEGSIGSCLPAADGRGRVYRAYVYRLHAAYTTMNSQHACGGA